MRPSKRSLAVVCLSVALLACGEDESFVASNQGGASGRAGNTTGFSGGRCAGGAPHPFSLRDRWRHAGRSRSSDSARRFLFTARCTDSPKPGWIDVTEQTAQANTIGRWTLKGRNPGP